MIGHDDPIRELVEPWTVRYRKTLFLLLACGLASGVSVFFENAALEALSRAIAAAGGAVVEEPESSAGPLAVVTGLGRRALLSLPPLVILSVMAGGRLFRLAMTVIVYIVGNQHKNRARDDLESRVLADLLAKDPGFFTTRPTGEILNRLGDDVDRVLAGRLAHLERFESLFLMAGNLLFFVDASAQMAILAVATTCLGVWLMQRVSQSGAEGERLALTADDAVKGRFEELLGMTQEVQVSDLGARVRRAFQDVQKKRRSIVDRNVVRSSMVGVVATVAYVVSLFSLVIVALYFLTVPNPDARAALIPVMLRALPDLFSSAMDIVHQNTTRRLGATSARRLREYEGDKDPPRELERAEPERAAKAIEMKDATFRYKTADGGLAGGVREVSTSLVPGRSTAIVGSSGAGKSTFLQLLLGQVPPQQGDVTMDGKSLGAMSSSERARIMALMPQTVALVDGSILDNLYFGRDPPAELPSADADVLDRLGILDLCRNRALDVEAGTSSVTDDVRRRVVEARKRIKERLEEADIRLVPASEEIPASYWTVEHLLRGRADRSKLLTALRDSSASAIVREVASSREAAPLLEWARMLIAGTKHLLMLGSHAASANLAPFPIDEDVWELRRSCAAPDKDATASIDADLLCVALTSSYAELASTCALGSTDFARIDRKSIGALADVVRDHVVSLEPGLVHPLLSWRDNLVFASVTLDNRRQEALLDRFVIEESTAAGLAPVLVKSGLASGVGRGGSRLSGGQRQLVALARTLLRRTPVVILDEPTSALDPANRARVSKLLDEWKDQRIVVLVSHDPELARACDDVRLFERGQLVASGPFAEVASKSTVFAESVRG